MAARPEGAAIRGVAMRVLPAALLVAAFALPGAAQDLPKRGERWNVAAADDLRVLAPAPPRRVEEIARDLALARAGLLAIAGAPDHQPPYPTTVILYRDDATLLSYHRRADGSPPQTSLLSALDRQGRVLALSLENLERDLPLAREVLAGDLVGQLLMNPPGWLRTGLTGLVARLEPARGATGPARLVERLSPAGGRDGREPEGRTAGRSGESPNVSASAGTGWPAPDLLLEAKPGDYPEAAIGLVRHLAHPRSERSSQLRRYLTLLRGGLPSGAAFEECFFQPFATLYTEVAQVAARGGAPAIELEPRAPVVTAARDLAYEDVVLALGDAILRSSPWNTVASEIHFRAVLDARPNDAAALRGIALARELDGRHDDARVLWAQALAAAPDDATTRTLFGWSLLEHFRHAVGARRGWEDPLPDQVAAARDVFASVVGGAVARGPYDPQAAHAAHAARSADASPGAPPVATAMFDEDAPPYALHGYGATFLYAREDLEPGIAALERAARRLPGDDQIAADFILLHGHAGNHNLAWDLRRERLLGRVAPELDAEVEKILVEEALHAANRLLLLQQKPGEAIALVRRAAAETRDPATVQELERLLAQMDRVAVELSRDAVFERFRVAYEEAKRLTGERRFDQARALLQPFAADDMEPAVRDAARDALGKIDQADR